MGLMRVGKVVGGAPAHIHRSCVSRLGIDVLFKHMRNSAYARDK